MRAGLWPMGLALLTGFGMTLVSMPAFLGWMRRLGFGQSIREEGPKSHFSKAGTPTMGGAVLMGAALVGSFWAGQLTGPLVVLWILALGSSAMGATDDLTKVFKKRNLGLKARHKLIIQFALGLGMGLYLVLAQGARSIEVPWVGTLVGAGWVLLLSLCVVVSTTNAVNLTDGLDGLAAGTVALAALAYAVIGSATGQSELAVAAASVVGACLGFLWFNCYPARVFMGDTGSMGLGGVLAGLALLTRTEFWLVLIGGVFVAEALSVVFQVVYFKATRGKRIFRMSPLHHHFEAVDPEMRVTAWFWICGALLATVGVCGFLGGRP
ncbi:MAG: phospho-N-acetylmuramoyl-pentapeptide-transferase [Candidatus Eremiobacterota bacterium]